MSSSPEALAATLASSALVVEAADRAAITAVGKDVVSWLNGLVTCDLAKRGAREAAYALLVEKKGRIQVDLFVLPLATPGEKPALALFVPTEKREHVLSVLDHHLIMEDVELAPADLALFAAHGPRAQELLEGATWGGPLDLLGKGGAVMAVPHAERAAFAERLAHAATARGGALVDDATWERVRIDAGLPRFGVEVDDTLYPQEASLEKLAVSFSKGCYLGQEVVYMLENRGHVKRKLVLLDLDGGDAPPRGAPVATPTGDVVGEVKSATMGLGAARPVAIAMVKYAQAQPGTELRVGEHAARVR